MEIVNQIFKHPKCNLFTVLGKNRIQPINNFIGCILQDNLKPSCVTHIRKICTSVGTCAKMFVDIENTHAYSILDKISFTPKYMVPLLENNKEVVESDDFQIVLDRNWRASTVSEIVKAFEEIKDYCINKNINLSDERFDKLVDGLMDHCEKLTDDELLRLLNCLAEYPQCESYTSHNFHDAWSALDDICCWKLVDWDVQTQFTFANAWFKLNLGKLCDYVYEVINRLPRKAKHLSKNDIVHVFFYHNICRKCVVDFEFEDAVERHINDMTIDEMAIVALGYFKSKSKIKLQSIMEAMIRKVTKEADTIHEISLTAILKVLRFSKPGKLTGQIKIMLNELNKNMDRLSNLCCLHMSLLGTGVHFPHESTLQKTSDRIVQDITEVDKVRIKDIERLLNVLTMFNFNPRTEPDIYKAAFEEIHREERLPEIVKYSRCLPSILNYFSLQNIYSYKLMDQVLDAEHIKEVYGKSAKCLPRELFSLDASITIECPDYKGNRLLPYLKYKGAKWLTEYSPYEFVHEKKLSAADKLMVDVTETVKNVVKDSKVVRVIHVLPHFSRPGKHVRCLPRELFSLDACITIDCQDYKGNRLPLYLKYKAVKWLTEYSHTKYIKRKKLFATEKYFFDTVETVKKIIKDEELLKVSHVLPHFPWADIILCKDVTTGKFVAPPGFENYILGDVMFPQHQGDVKWYSIVVVGWNNTIRDTSLVMGSMLMKERQLKKIGYNPIFVIWNQYMLLSEEQKISYLAEMLH